jgi:hypothetical protein
MGVGWNLKINPLPYQSEFLLLDIDEFYSSGRGKGENDRNPIVRKR